MNQKHNKLRALSLLITVLIEKDVYPALQEHLVSPGRGYDPEMLGPLKIDNGEHAVNDMLLHYRVYLFNKLRASLKEIERQENQSWDCHITHLMSSIEEIKSFHVESREDKSVLANTRATVLGLLKERVTDTYVDTPWDHILHIRLLDEWLSFFGISRAEITTSQTLPRILNEFETHEHGALSNDDYYHKFNIPTQRKLTDAATA